MISSSKIISSIIQSDTETFKSEINNLIEEQIGTFIERLKNASEKNIESKLAIFYDSEKAEKDYSLLYSDKFDWQIQHPRGDSYNYQKELDKYKLFKQTIDDIIKNEEKCFYLTSRISNLDDYSIIFTKKYIFTSKEPSYPDHERGKKYITNMNDNNISFNILLFLKKAKGMLKLSSIDSARDLFELLTKNVKDFLPNNVEFEVICKKEYEYIEEQKRIVEQEKEEIIKQKDFYKGLLGDYDDYLQSKKDIEEERKKLSIAKICLDKKRKQLDEEWKQLEKEKKELEELRADNLDLDEYFNEEQNKSSIKNI